MFIIAEAHVLTFVNYPAQAPRLVWQVLLNLQRAADVQIHAMYSLSSSKHLEPKVMEITDINNIVIRNNIRHVEINKTD